MNVRTSYNAIQRQWRPRYISRKQADQAPTREDVESELENLDPKAISKNMEKNTHARKTQKRNQLSAKYQQEISSLDQEALSIADSATKYLADIRHDQQQRLHRLIRRRAELEGQIVQHCQVLDHAYVAANREMRTAAKGRLEDLQWDNGEGEELEGCAGDVDGRQVPVKEVVENGDEMAGKGTRA